MNLTPEERSTGKENFYEAIGSELTRGAIFSSKASRPASSREPGWERCTLAMRRRSAIRYGSASSAPATKAACCWGP